MLLKLRRRRTVKKKSHMSQHDIDTDPRRSSYQNVRCNTRNRLAELDDVPVLHTATPPSTPKSMKGVKAESSTNSSPKTNLADTPTRKTRSQAQAELEIEKQNLWPNRLRKSSPRSQMGSPQVKLYRLTPKSLNDKFKKTKRTISQQLKSGASPNQKSLPSSPGDTKKKGKFTSDEMCNLPETSASSSLLNRNTSSLIKIIDCCPKSDTTLSGDAGCHTLSHLVENCQKTYDNSQTNISKSISVPSATLGTSSESIPMKESKPYEFDSKMFTETNLENPVKIYTRRPFKQTIVSSPRIVIKKIDITKKQLASPTFVESSEYKFSKSPRSKSDERHNRSIKIRFQVGKDGMSEIKPNIDKSGFLPSGDNRETDKSGTLPSGGDNRETDKSGILPSGDNRETEMHNDVKPIVLPKIYQQQIAVKEEKSDVLENIKTTVALPKQDERFGDQKMSKKATNIPTLTEKGTTKPKRKRVDSTSSNPSISFKPSKEKPAVIKQSEKLKKKARKSLLQKQAIDSTGLSVATQWTPDTLKMSSMKLIKTCSPVLKTVPRPKRRKVKGATTSRSKKFKSRNKLKGIEMYFLRNERKGNASNKLPVGPDGYGYLDSLEKKLSKYKITAEDEHELRKEHELLEEEELPKCYLGRERHRLKDFRGFFLQNMLKPKEIPELLTECQDQSDSFVSKIQTADFASKAPYLESLGLVSKSKASSTSDITADKGRGERKGFSKEIVPKQANRLEKVHSRRRKLFGHSVRRKNDSGKDEPCYASILEEAGRTEDFTMSNLEQSACTRNIRRLHSYANTHSQILGIPKFAGGDGAMTTSSSRSQSEGRSVPPQRQKPQPSVTPTLTQSRGVKTGATKSHRSKSAPRSQSKQTKKSESQTSVTNINIGPKSILNQSIYTLTQLGNQSKAAKPLPQTIFKVPPIKSKDRLPLLKIRPKKEASHSSPNMSQNVKITPPGTPSKDQTISTDTQKSALVSHPVLGYLLQSTSPVEDGFDILCPDGSKVFPMLSIEASTAIKQECMTMTTSALSVNPGNVEVQVTQGCPTVYYMFHPVQPIAPMPAVGTFDATTNSTGASQNPLVVNTNLFPGPVIPTVPVMASKESCATYQTEPKLSCASKPTYSIAGDSNQLYMTFSGEGSQHGEMQGTCNDANNNPNIQTTQHDPQLVGGRVLTNLPCSNLGVPPMFQGGVLGPSDANNSQSVAYITTLLSTSDIGTYIPVQVALLGNQENKTIGESAEVTSTGENPKPPLFIANSTSN